MRYVVITVFLFFAVMPVFSRGETLKIQSIYPSRVGNLTVEKGAFLAQSGDSKAGIGTTNLGWGSKIGILGEIAVGDSSYSDNISVPTGGAIIQGNVGIGITNPTEKLHVVGNITTSGKVFMGWEKESKSSAYNTTIVRCSDENKKVIGGGCSAIGGQYWVGIYSYPSFKESSASQGNGWVCDKEVESSDTVTAYAICASIGE